MIGDYFYHTTIRRFVSVFGTIFNDIKVSQDLSRLQSVPNKSFIRVPLAYGPREKYLARILQQPDAGATNFAIKLPRMSFEITGLSYDTQSKLNKNNKLLIGEKIYYTFAPYNISISLSIMTKTQDEALQILEQIVPYFQPDYTVTIKEGIDNSLKTDVPISLSNITMTEEYEGDFMSRRAIIYTLDFEAKIRFYGPEMATGLIKKVKVLTADYDNRNNGYEQQVFSVSPNTAVPPEEYSIVEELNILDVINSTTLTVYKNDISGTVLSYILGETVIGQKGGASGTVVNIVTLDTVIKIEIINVTNGDFDVEEVVVGQSSGANKQVIAYSKNYI